MSAESFALPAILQRSRTRVVFGPGTLDELGILVLGEGASRALLVTDPGIVRAGHVARAVASLERAEVAVALFDAVDENPSTAHVAAGVEAARACNANVLIGLGGGSSMDCAKGINFILTNGGSMADYWGVDKATKPMLPMIAAPTTAGTGSEAQSFALIRDPVTHQKMACGDVKAACRVAVLDPELTRTQPCAVAAATGLDALSHAVETAATTKRSDTSMAFTAEAWSRLNRSFERAMGDPADDQARSDMLIGAHLAGCAIERSMLGAAHACANPLTARYDVTHGAAVGVMLPHVVRFNLGADANPYDALGGDGDALADRLEAMLVVADLPRRLADHGIPEAALPALAEEAARQWTARFNPRPVGAAELLDIYRAAFA